MEIDFELVVGRVKRHVSCLQELALSEMASNKPEIPTKIKGQKIDL